MGRKFIYTLLIIAVSLFALPIFSHAGIVVNDSFNPGANNTVYAIAVRPSGKILVGGDFTILGGQTRNYIGQVNPDGSLDTDFNPDANSSVYAIAVQNDDKTVIGGYFTSIAGQTRNGIARLNGDGTLDTAFSPGDGIGGGGITAIAIQADGKIVVGGTFIKLGGQARNYIGRLNADGSLDTSFNPGISNYSYVKTLAVQPNGKILVGGYFTSIGGYGRNHIGRLNADGSVDTSFNPGAGGEVDAITVQSDGKILVGGYFTTLGGSSRTRIGRLNADGTIDYSFNPGTGANNSVYAIAIQSNGKIVLGGNFVQLGGQIWVKSFGRLNSDGTLDTTFLTPAPNGPVNALAIQSDGSILLGGTFTTFNAQSRYFVGREGNSDTSAESLTVDSVGETATWTQSGSFPSPSRVIFEQSADGQTWTMMGEGSPVSGAWQLGSLSLPIAQGFYVRARAYAPSGCYSGSTSMYETVRYYAPQQPPTISGSPATNVTTGAFYSFTPMANNATTFTVTNKPSWTTFNAATGALTGTPASADVGTYSDIVITAVNNVESASLSAFSITVVPVSYGLSLSVTGSGIIHTSPGADLACSGICGQNYTSGTVVTLTAGADTGYVFSAWSGCDSTSGNQCTVTMTGIKNIAAAFADITPPDTMITSNPEALTHLTSFSFTFSASEINSTFECKIGNDSWGTCLSPYSNSLVCAQGTACRIDNQLSFSVRAKDPAGNYDPTPATWAWTINYPLSDLIDNVKDGGLVQLPAIDFVNNLTFSKEITFALKGGYASDYQSQIGMTTIHGAMTITAGTVNIENIVIAP